MKAFDIHGVVIQQIRREPCDRLVQFGKGQPITCKCSACSDRNQTPEQAQQSVAMAIDGAMHQCKCVDSYQKRSDTQALRLQIEANPAQAGYF